MLLAGSAAQRTFEQIRMSPSQWLRASPGTARDSAWLVSLFQQRSLPDSELGICLPRLRPIPCLTPLLSTRPRSPFSRQSVRACGAQAMKMATAQAADAYWRLLGEMNRRYMGDLRALEAVVEQYKKPPLSAVRRGRMSFAARAKSLQNVQGVSRRHRIFELPHCCAYRSEQAPDEHNTIAAYSVLGRVWFLGSEEHTQKSQP